MAAHNHEHAEHHSGTKRIWSVFVILAIVTIIEVGLGIARPSFLIDKKVLSLHLLNWIFIILTIVKAYYITWAFMHMEQETKGLRRSVVWTAVFLICYLVAILLTEGDYLHYVYQNGYLDWNF